MYYCKWIFTKPISYHHKKKYLDKYIFWKSPDSLMLLYNRNLGYICFKKFYISKFLCLLLKSIT